MDVQYYWDDATLRYYWHMYVQVRIDMLLDRLEMILFLLRDLQSLPRGRPLPSPEYSTLILVSIHISPDEVLI